MKSIPGFPASFLSNLIRPFPESSEILIDKALFSNSNQSTTRSNMSSNTGNSITSLFRENLNCLIKTFFEALKL